jgi:16S rRNA (guanine527-N7)-methyltransferase
MSEANELELGGLSVSRETFAALKQLEGLVRRWTPVVNLVSKSTLADLWNRHIVDSAQLFAFCPQDARSWLDIGSGGGFPGLVVAILAREGRPAMMVSLAESDQRKAAFLRQAVQALNLRVDVRATRVESLPPQSADVLSARALAPLGHLLAFAEKHLARDGVGLFPKGARFAEEMADARKQWSFDVKPHPSISEPQAAILEIRKVSRAA